MTSYLFNRVYILCCGILAIIAVCWVWDVYSGGTLIKDIILPVKLSFSSQYGELVSAEWKHWSIVAAVVGIGTGLGTCLFKYGAHAQIQIVCIVMTYFRDILKVSKICFQVEYGNYYITRYIWYSMVLRNVCILGMGSLLIFFIVRRQKMSHCMKKIAIFVGAAVATNGGIADSWDSYHKQGHFFGIWFCYSSAMDVFFPGIMAWILWSCLVKREESLEGEKTKESTSAVESTC